jgi:hypothetical protein
LANLIPLQGCILGPLLLENFFLNTPVHGPNAGQIFVRFSSSGGVFGVSWEFTGFSVTSPPPTTVHASMGFNVDPHPIINRFEDELDSYVLTGSASVEVATDLCVGGAFSGGCSGSFVDNATTVFASSSTTTLFSFYNISPAVDDLGVWNDVTWTASSVSQLNRFTNRILTTIPEPGSAALAGLGLLLLGLHARHRRL